MSSNGNGSGQLPSFSSWQQIWLITSTMIGVGVLTLPRTTTETLREVGRMAPLLGSVIALFSILLIARLSRRFPELTFIQYCRMIWGSKKTAWVGKILSFPWIFSFLAFYDAVTATTTRIFGEVVARVNERLFLGVWVAAIFTAVRNVYYAVIYGLKQYFGKGMAFQRITAFLLLIPLFSISLIPLLYITVSWLRNWGNCCKEERAE